MVVGEGERGLGEGTEEETAVGEDGVAGIRLMVEVERLVRRRKKVKGMS